MLDNDWNGSSGDLNGGFKEGYVGITDFNECVPQDVRDAALFAKEQIMNGSMQVYTGPISDNDGNTVVPEGVVLTHTEIMGIDWFVEGVN